MAALRSEPDVSVGGWVADGLGPFGARIGSLVPPVFEAYARVLHPVGDAAGFRWTDVAAATGRTLHPTAQFRALAGYQPGTSQAPAHPAPGMWAGGDPPVGHLPAAQTSALVEVLAGHTGRPRDCVFALWEGWGWLDGGGVLLMVARAAADDAPGPPLPRPRGVPGWLSGPVLDAPRFHLPNRDYLLFRGPAQAAVAMADGTATVLDRTGAPGGGWAATHPDHGGQAQQQSANLMWPADHAWCVATEIDLDSTVVGGSAELVAEILATPDLEAVEVTREDSLGSDGDSVNVP